MRGIRFESLAKRIWITYAIIILITLSISLILYIYIFREFEEKHKVEDLSVIHELLLKYNNSDHVYNELKEIKNVNDSKHFILTKSNNDEIYISDTSKRKESYHAVYEDSIRYWMSSFINEDNLYERKFKETYGEYKVIFIVTSLENQNKERTYLISYIKDNSNYNLEYLIIGIVITFIILGLVVTRIVAESISRPFKKLENFTKKIANKDWEESVEISGVDEIGRLANAMNEMQKALKRANEEEKIYLESISHDLKTPVMVIMSHAEAIIDGIYIESAENTAKIIKVEAENLHKKINQLVYLSTLDYVLKNSSNNVDINLHELIMNIISRFKLMNTNVVWEIEISEVFINGNGEKIGVVIENLLDNELRYAKKRIKVSLKKENAYALIEIYNDGPKIEEKNLEHIFDNMYKGKSGNFGIGLAICRKIIEFYKGEILAINREVGVSFIVKLPAIHTYDEQDLI